MSPRTWNLPHPYIICNLRSPRREVKIARLSGRSVLCRLEGQNGEGRTWGEPESWATEYPSCGFGRDTFSPVSCVMTQEIHPRRWFQDSPGK
ncbi:rCG55186, partial [Rattus norvegicus]